MEPIFQVERLFFLSRLQGGGQEVVLVRDGAEVSLLRFIWLKVRLISSLCSVTYGLEVLVDDCEVLGFW